MGKAKRRSINLGKHDQFTSLTRDDAVKKVIMSFKKRQNDVHDLITLFGLSAEELLEGGADFEDVKSIEGILND